MSAWPCRHPDRHLGGEEDFLAAGLHDLADPLLAGAVAVCIGGIDVVDAQVQRVVQRRDALLFVVLENRLPAPKATILTRAPVRPRRRFGRPSAPSPDEAATLPRAAAPMKFRLDTSATRQTYHRPDVFVARGAPPVARVPWTGADVVGSVCSAASLPPDALQCSA